MASQKKIMKLLVIIILAIFIFSSALVSVLYFIDMNKTSEVENNFDVVETEEILDQSFEEAN